MIVVEQASNPFPAKHAAVRVRGLRSTIDQEVFEVLVISLSMIVLDESREPDDLHASAFEGGAKPGRVQRIPVEHQIALSEEEPVLRVT